MKSFFQDKIVLASQSPRRKELLEQMGLKIEILPADIDEANGKDLEPIALVKDLSRLKTRAVLSMCRDAWVIGADTIVVVDNRILGKPGSEQEAVQMLEFLTGREHSVLTGFTVGHEKKDKEISRVVETRVRFKSMSDNEILWYAKSTEPYDKAGGYGIQGMGGFMVESICGSYSNVVGLPLCEVMETLMELGAIQFTLKSQKTQLSTQC